MPAKYPEEFRDDVVRVALNRAPEVTLAQIAKDFGIHVGTLDKWLRQARIEDGEKPGTTRSENDELRELRRRNRLLEQEVEVLRRAAATSGRAASAQGSRVLSPRTPAQGAAGKAVGRAGSQGVSARGASGTTQARGALGRAQRAFGLGRAASSKKKDDPKVTEHLGEQVLTTDSRLSFLGRGQRDDAAKRDIASDSE